MHLCQQVLIKSERIRFCSRFFSFFFSLLCSGPLRRCIPCLRCNESERIKCDNGKHQRHQQHMTSSDAAKRSDRTANKQPNVGRWAEGHEGERRCERNIYIQTFVNRKNFCSFLMTVSAIDSMPTEQRTYCATQF